MNLEKDLGFDLYGRYAIIRDLIKKNGTDKDSVLDVGGRGNLLKKFIPNNKVIYIDPYVDSDDVNFVKGDGCNMPFDDGSFDWVVSADVFEHIPRELRVAFVSEHIRVARRGIVIAAPFHSSGSATAETNINEFHKSLTNTSHPWLKEHIVNGLPKLEDLTSSREVQQYEFDIYGNNDLQYWEQILSSMILHDKLGKSFPSEFNEFYNARYNFDLFAENTYRKLVFIKKDKALISLTKPEYQPDIEKELKKKIEALDGKTRNALVSEFVRSTNIINEKRIIEEQKDNYINELRIEQLANKQIYLDRIGLLEAELSVFQTSIDALKNTIDTKIAEAHESDRIIIEQKDSYINELKVVHIADKRILEDKTITLSAECDKLKETLNLVEKNAQNTKVLNFKIQDAESKLTKAQFEQKRTERRLKILTQKLHLKEVEASKLIADIKKGEAAMSNCIEKEKDLNKKLQQSEKRILEEQTQHNTLFQKLESKLEDCKLENQEIQKQRDVDKEKINELTLELTKVQVINVAKDQTIPLLKKEIDKNENLLRLANSKCENLHSELLALQIVVENIKSKTLFKLFYKGKI